MKRNYCTNFIYAYAECALWSSIDPDGSPLDDYASIEDIAPETMAEMRSDCVDFIWSNRADLREYCARMDSEQWPGMVQSARDFWLTRNRHGAGFWDRGLGDLGKRLSDAARCYGSIDLHLGDDGMVYS